MRIDSLHAALAYFPDCDGFWGGNDLVITEMAIRDRLPSDWATTWTESTVITLTQLARAQGLRSDLLAARATLDQAQHMLKESNANPSPLGELRWLLEHGR